MFKKIGSYLYRYFRNIKVQTSDFFREKKHAAKVKLGRAEKPVSLEIHKSTLG